MCCIPIDVWLTNLILMGACIVDYLLTYLLTCLLTYLLTPWSRVLLEKLTGLQLVKKFPAFYGTRRFITARNQCPLSLSNGRSPYGHINQRM
jgi:hypothetical protein